MEVARVRELYLEELQGKKRRHDQTHVPVKKQKGFKLVDLRHFSKGNKYGPNHPGECRAGGAVRFKCGKPDHMKRDCGATLKLKFIVMSQDISNLSALSLRA